MAFTGNAFSELETIGDLDPFASRDEILERLRNSGEKERARQKEGAAQLVRTKSARIGKFSDEERQAIESEGWTVVKGRERTRPIAAINGGEATESPRDSFTSAEKVVVSRGLPASLAMSESGPPPRKHGWKLVRWGALGVLGAIALAKLAVRR